MTAEIPEWASTLGDEGPKPYEATAWTYTTVSVVEDEPEEPVDPPWWETVGPTTVAPYETSSWAFALVEEEIEGSCEPSEFEDRDDLSCSSDQEWWTEIGGAGPKPYETVAWTVTTQVVEEVDEAQSLDSISYETYTPADSWWESLGGQGPKPYNAAAWTFTRVESFELEFVAVSKVLFQAFDETYFDRTSLGLILDSGYFGQVGTSVYDEAYFLGDERGILVKRTISRLMVYDSRASSPGAIGSFLQPLGTLASDPVEAVEELSTNPDDNQIALFEGGPIGLDPLAEPVGTDPDATGLLTETFVGLLGLDPINTTAEIVTDPDENILELVRHSNGNDDTPPGTLLGSVSYETFDGVLTITDWEHLNWEDDAPVLMGVKTLLSQIPDGVTEVRVLDPPHAFWTSLGFAPEYKGDPYLHIHL